MKHKLIWPGFLLFLLGLNGVIVGITIRLATHDASFSVEPDYDRQAMHWDQTAQQTVQNQTLGWSLDLVIEQQSDGSALASVQLRDKDRKPLTGAGIMAIAFHSGRASDRQSLTFQERDLGMYTVPIKIDRSGLWEFRLVASSAKLRFTEIIERHIDVRAGEENRP